MEGEVCDEVAGDLLGCGGIWGGRKETDWVVGCQSGLKGFRHGGRVVFYVIIFLSWCCCG